MKTLSCAFCRVLLFMVLLASSRVAQAALPLVDRVPADAVVYIGWAGSESQAEVYQKSDLRAVLEHSNLPELARQYVPKWLDQLKQQGAGGEQLEGVKKVLAMLWKHPTAFYVSGVTTGPDGTPDAKLAMICDGGSDAAELHAELVELFKGMPDFLVSTQDSLVIVSSKKGTEEPLLSSLTTNATFESAMKTLQDLPAVAVFIDGKTLRAKLDESASKDTHGAAELWPKVREALGIANITSLAMTGGFDGTNWMTRAVLQAPMPRTGLLAAFEPQVIDPELLARIPASADSVSVTDVDFAKLVDTIGDAMAVHPASDKMFHQANGALTILLGANFRRQIIGPLGSQWVLYSDPHGPGAVLMNHPLKASTAENSMVSVVFGLVNEINSQVPGASKKPVVTAVQSQVNHVDLTSAVFAGGSPTVAVHKGILYFGASPATVSSAAAAADAMEDKDLLHAADFQSAVTRLGGPEKGSFTYCDVPDTAQRAVKNLEAANDQVKLLLSRMGVDIPKVQLPPIEQIRGNLSPAMSMSWGDAQGIYCKSVSPFPLSEDIFGDPQQTLVGVGTVAGATAILLPALERARAQARRVQESSQQRQLLTGMMMYANDHHGQFPPDLAGTLSYLSNAADPKAAIRIYLKPESAQKIPENIGTWTPDKQAEWVNANTDDLYLTPNYNTANPNASQTAVLVPKDAEDATQPVSVGFADGHVEVVPPKKVHDILHPVGADGSRDGL